MTTRSARAVSAATDRLSPCVRLDATSVATLAGALRTAAFGAISDDEANDMSAMLDLLENPR